MNHLNLFHLYSQNEYGDPVENNLSRALAICLKSDALFLAEFIRNVIDCSGSKQATTDFDDLFNLSNEESSFAIQLQVDTKQLTEADKEPAIVYAIAMTTRELDTSVFNTLQPTKTKDARNITDIVIHLNDALFIIEVKRSAEDCRQQLFNQVDCFSHKENIRPVSFSWEQVLRILLRVKKIHRANNYHCYPVNDFIQLLDTHYSHWFPPAPFANLSFQQDIQSVEGKRLQRRLYQAMEYAASISTYPLKDFKGRTVFAVNFIWANEVQPYFITESDKKYLALYIWPANTKRQGNAVYYKPDALNWTKKESIQSGNNEYPLEINYEVKFCHFNGFVSQVVYEDPSDLTTPLHTAANFEESGEYTRDKWNEVEEWMDEHFPKEFNWRIAAGWQEKFLDSERTYLTIALGFEVKMLIPYSELQQIDKKEEDYKSVAKILLDGVQALQQLID